MTRAIRSLRIEFSEEQRSEKNCLQTLAFVDEELSKLVNNQECFVSMVLEMARNIYHHASAEGVLEFVLEGDVCRFNITDCKLSSDPVGTGKGEGLSLIRARADSLKIELDTRLFSEYQYSGVYVLQTPENVYELSA